MNLSRYRSALSLAALAVVLSACGGNSDDAEVSTTSGTVRGTYHESTVSYLGIPYAAPPTGTRRWKAPEAPASWTGVRSAKAFGAHCPQGASPFGEASTNEDCLFLNVYTPKAAGKYPVLVWIHGGAFYLGLSNGYDPTKLVEQGVVVVTINYRLGALGFMAHPALTAEQGGHSGNYGLMDQQAALSWVKSNIARFGGNADNVTIAGESAGGFSVHSHVASAGSAGLFHKAIAMSGAYPFSADQDPLSSAYPIPTAESKGQTVATKAAELISTATGVTVPTCTTAECLRALPVSALLGAQATAYPSGPIPAVDGVVLSESVRTTIAAGRHNKVPMIEGTTRDEWNLFAALDEYANGLSPVLTSDTDHINTVAALMGHPYVGTALSTATNLVTYVYPSSNYGGDVATAYGALGTDMIFACNGRIAALELQQHNSVYAYEFRDRTAPVALPHRSSFSMGAAHTSELKYLFGMGGTALNADQTALSTTMIRYWANFAKTGNPNGSGVPTWSAYTQANDSYQGLDLSTAGGVGPLSTSFATAHHCTTWNGGTAYTPTP